MFAQVLAHNKILQPANLQPAKTCAQHAETCAKPTRHSKNLRKTQYESPKIRILCATPFYTRTSQCRRHRLAKGARAPPPQ